MELSLKLKNLNTPKLPAKAHADDAGFDIVSPQSAILEPGAAMSLPLGFAMAIPAGYVGLMVPRSSTGSKGLALANTMGVIDAGYRGEVVAKLVNRGTNTLNFQAGDRILQLLLMPVSVATAVEVAELDETVRGKGGFGSTGH